jgi:hypothetical protein
MASALYPKAKQSFLSQNPSIDLDSGTIKVALVSTTDYTYSAAHQYKSSVTSYGASTDQTLGSIGVTDGVFDAGDATFTSVAVDGTKAANALVIYQDSGSAATSPLIAYIDGFSVTPNGGNINVVWDDGANKIFKL